MGQEYLQPFPWGMQGHFQSPQLRACLSLTKTFPGTAAVEWSLEFGAVGVGEVGQKAACRQAAGGQRRLAAGSLLVPVPGGLGPAALLRFSTVSMQVMSRTCGLCSVLVTR